MASIYTADGDILFESAEIAGLDAAIEATSAARRGADQRIRIPDISVRLHHDADIRRLQEWFAGGLGGKRDLEVRGLRGPRVIIVGAFVRHWAAFSSRVELSIERAAVAS
jgi:hypothetical protein